MRKILLGTTAVAGAALFAVSTAQAQQAPTVRIGGFMLGTATIINDDADKARTIGGSTTLTGDRQGVDFRNELEVHVFVTGKAANGLEYGAVIEFQNDGVNGSTVDLDEAYVFVSSPTLGTIRFGEEDNAASLMQVRVPTIAGFGPDSEWDDGVVARATSGGRIDRAAPSLLTGLNDGNDATKIVYLSPQFAGFDIGLSYAPNGGEGERAWSGLQLDRGDTSSSIAQRDYSGITNEVSAAIRYRGTFGGVGVQVGLAGMWGDAEKLPSSSAAQQDIYAYSVGLNLSAFGFTVGGEYTWGKYGGESVGRTSLPSGAAESNHYVIGATYTAGAISVGAFYGVAEQARTAIRSADRPASGDREQTVWGIGVAYALAPGLELIGSYTALSDENGPTNLRNGSTSNTRDLDVFLLGARIAF